MDILRLPQPDAAPAHGPRGEPAEMAWTLLEQLDQGLMLVDAQGRLKWANRAARAALGDAAVWRTAPLRLVDSAANLRWRQALHAAAHRGRHGWVSQAAAPPAGACGEPDAAAKVMLHWCLQPCGAADAQGLQSVLVAWGRAAPCSRLALEACARAHGLTLAETQVLWLFARGLGPREMAQTLGVKLSTVRTHLEHIRAKTGTCDQRGLMRLLAMLPAVPTLRWATVR